MKKELSKLIKQSYSEEEASNLHSAGYLGQKIIIAGGSAKKPQN